MNLWFTDPNFDYTLLYKSMALRKKGQSAFLVERAYLIYGKTQKYKRA